jgi:hypothetical protein
MKLVLPGYHATALGGTVLVCIAIAAAAVSGHLRQGDDEPGPDLTKLEAIEVSVARPAKPARQPQKQHREPVHQADQGVSRDDKKPPDDKKKPDDKHPKPDDNKDGPTSAIPDDTDTPAGKPTSDMGQFNPNKFGNAAVDKGDPYLRELVTDVLAAGGDFPKILSASGNPLACIHLDPDGKVVETLFKEKSNNPDLDDWVDHALKTFKDKRNQQPKQVPTRLLETITGWICFHFDLDKQ